MSDTSLGITPTPRPHFRFGLRTMFVVAGASVVCLLVLAVQGIRVSLDAENTHQAYLATLEYVADYLKANPGKWPENWQAVRGVAPATDRIHSIEGLEDFKRRVNIDFSLTCDEVAKMTPEAFSAVQPSLRNYGSNESRILQIIDAAKQPKGLAQP